MSDTRRARTCPRRTRSFVAGLLATVTVLVGTAAAPASAAGGANNVVLVSNYVDEALAARASVQVAHAPAETVTNENLATAEASCVGCRTVAVAVQVVIVEGYPSDFRPHNAAGAVNSECSFCLTVAYANQIIVQPAVMVYLDPEAQRQVHRIRTEMSAAASSDLGLFELVAQFDFLAEQLADAVVSNMNRAGVDAASTVHRSVHIPTN